MLLREGRRPAAKLSSRKRNRADAKRGALQPRNLLSPGKLRKNRLGNCPFFIRGKILEVLPLAVAENGEERMKNRLICLSAGVLFFVVGCLTGYAQGTAQVSGTVKDQTGAVLPGTPARTCAGVLLPVHPA